MKRRDLIRHFESHGCELLREGGRHSWWHNPSFKELRKLEKLVVENEHTLMEAWNEYFSS
jgi:mRNA interferase HicA